MYEVRYLYENGTKVYSDSMIFTNFEDAREYADWICYDTRIRRCSIYRNSLLVMDVF